MGVLRRLEGVALLRVLERLVCEAKPKTTEKSEFDLGEFQVRDWLVADATLTPSNEAKQDSSGLSKLEADTPS